MMSLVRIAEFKNGEEKKRNPRKERSRKKCLIHSICMARTRKALHYANSGGGEYLCEFSSLVLMKGPVRISESGREVNKTSGLKS
jgi:hypothetical protein